MSILIIGGAGFIGANLAAYYCKKGVSAIVFDNLQREKTNLNLAWLEQEHKERLTFVKGDIRHNIAKLKALIEEVDVVFHLAGQVAVTTSVQDPLTDFTINAQGTLNVLEALRLSKKKPILLYSSTNKVYGDLAHVALKEGDQRYDFADHPLGISEEQPLDFHSPYGCSKGTADQYVRDYARIYGLRTVVFRQSCIYGYRQFGCEDQGWVAWFTIASLLQKPITVYGNGKQTRDLLFVDDLCRAFELAVEHIATTSGQIYNIGGGSENTLSLLELLEMLEQHFQRKIPYTLAAMRPGDQRIFVCDVSKAYRDFTWKPETSVFEGVKKLITWTSTEFLPVLSQNYFPTTSLLEL